jgi:hypothetical protein
LPIKIPENEFYQNKTKRKKPSSEEILRAFFERHLFAATRSKIPEKVGESKIIIIKIRC